MMTQHQLETKNGRLRCTMCGQTWKNPPASECVGVSVYAWGQWPEHLLTKKQMGDAGYQTGKKLPAPAGACYREKSPDGIMWLYDRSQGVPKKVISAEARESLKAAAEKSRQGWYCTRCGQPHGEVYRRDWRPYKLNPPGLCTQCKDRELSMKWAGDLLSGDFVILDTETTGLTDEDEIVQIAVIDPTGKALLNTYVQPLRAGRLLEKHDGLSASDINGITPDMLTNAPIWPDVYAQLATILTGKRVVIYNAAFDERMIQDNCRLHGIVPAPFEAECAMLEYARWYGVWSSYFKDYRWQPLNGGHDALGDCLTCLELIKQMVDSDKRDSLA